MKNYTKSIFKLFIGAMLIAIPLQSVTANNNSSINIDIEKIVKDKFSGGWSYTVQGAPEGYQEGLLVIVKAGDSYKVQIQIAGGTLMGENVRTKGHNIMFDVMIEGDKVAVDLAVNGSKLSGKTTSSEGTFTVSGVKTLSAE